MEHMLLKEVHYDNSDDYLIHWGILGMKWGVRKYQNPDGSLTEAGKRRYLKDYNKKSGEELLKDSRIKSIVDRSSNLKYEKDKITEKLDKYISGMDHKKYNAIAGAVSSISMEETDTKSIIESMGASNDMNFVNSVSAYVNLNNKEKDIDKDLDKYFEAKDEYENSIKDALYEEFNTPVKDFDETVKNLGNKVVDELDYSEGSPIILEYDHFFDLGSSLKETGKKAEKIVDKLGINDSSNTNFSKISEAVEELGLSDKPFLNLTDEDINKINNYTMTHSFIDSYELYHSKNFK